MNEKLPRAQRRFRTRPHVGGAASVLLPRRAPRSYRRHTNERETFARAAPPSGAPPRWHCGPRLFPPGSLRAQTEVEPMNAKLPHAQRRFRARRHVGSLGLGNFTSAHCALIWKTHERAQTEGTLAAPLRLFPPGTLRAQTEVEPTQGELPHAQRPDRTRRHVGSAASVIPPLTHCAPEREPNQ